jgi:hypothetical protein
MHPVPKTASEALRIFHDPTSEDWERDYAAALIAELEEGREALLATARDTNASEMLQQRAAECLAKAWRAKGMLMTADVSDFTPVATQEVLFQRGEGSPCRSNKPRC